MLTDHTNAHYIINKFILYWEIVKGTFMPKINELKLFRKWRSHKTLKNFRRLSSNCILFVFYYY